MPGKAQKPRMELYGAVSSRRFSESRQARRVVALANNSHTIEYRRHLASQRKVPMDKFVIHYDRANEIRKAVKNDDDLGENSKQYLAKKHRNKLKRDSYHRNAERYAIERKAKLDAMTPDERAADRSQKNEWHNIYNKRHRAKIRRQKHARAKAMTDAQSEAAKAKYAISQKAWYDQHKDRVAAQRKKRYHEMSPEKYAKRLERQNERRQTTRRADLDLTPEQKIEKARKHAVYYQKNKDKLTNKRRARRAAGLAVSKRPKPKFDITKSARWSFVGLSSLAHYVERESEISLCGRDIPRFKPNLHGPRCGVCLTKARGLQL